jgi:hypothetical protein
MGRKADLKQVDAVAGRYGMTPEQRREFGDDLEECKRSGDGGSSDRGDFTDDELRAKANEFLEETK